MYRIYKAMYSLCRNHTKQEKEAWYRHLVTNTMYCSGNIQSLWQVELHEKKVNKHMQIMYH